MKASGDILFRVLMNRFPVLPADALLAFLPEEESEAVRAQVVLGDDPVDFLMNSVELLDKIHYSWMIPNIDKLPPAIQDTLIQALSEPTRSRLQAQLKRPMTTVPPMLSVQALLKRQLSNEMGLPDVLPLSFLPESPLMAVATLSKEELVQAIDLLSMHDLAEEIRHVVDKKKLQSVYQLLSSQKAQYLKRCLQQRERIVNAKLELDKYLKDLSKLESVLHQRGILRLGRALSGQDPDLLWHIMHRLDIGRGSILQKCYQKQPIPNVTALLIEQVLTVINFLKTEKTS